MRRIPVYLALCGVLVWVLASCSSVRHVPKGSLLLDKVNVRINDSTGTFTADQMRLYLRQQPNHKFLWSVPLQLGVYNMSGADTSKRINRWIRSLGEAPVIYDSLQTALSAQQLRKAMINKGFLEAEVRVDTFSRPGSRKMRVDYTLTAGKPHVINSIEYEVADTAMERIVSSRLNRSYIAGGDYLDVTLLEQERERITEDMRRRGYFGFSKEAITFSADTTSGSSQVGLTVKIGPPHNTAPSVEEKAPPSIYFLRRVIVVLDYDPATMGASNSFFASDTLQTKEGLLVLSNGKPYLRPSVIDENIRFRPGQRYNSRLVTRTYQSLSRLEILNFAGIKMVPAGESADLGLLDAYVLLTPGKSQSMSLELEGTNSEGDLGVAAAIGWSHRNIGRGSETLSLRVRGAYESLSGDLDGLLHDRYMEYSADISLNYPRFKAPFLSSAFKRSIIASSRLHFGLTYQQRPEYTRVLGAAGWSYLWSRRDGRHRHTFTPIDINYVYLPESTNEFIDQIAPDNPLLRYSYEDHFIMSMAYRFYATSKREGKNFRTQQKDIWTLRATLETAGNLLYAINSIVNHHEHPQQDPYKVLGIRYSQYVKGEVDYSFTHIFDRRNSLAFHTGLGLAYPYGNSRVLPFEKRFYGGGASGVRGWDVRTLGPGSYDATNSVSSFINQCGDIRFDLSLEYRAKLFWVVELGLFIDAGNIWTIHNYPNQPGGMFHFNTFYKQIAAAYGLGLRLDFNYFLLRFDMGMKAHNPAKGQEPWPLIHPRWGRDSSFHFSIGYPF